MKSIFVVFVVLLVVVVVRAAPQFGFEFRDNSGGDRGVDGQRELNERRESGGRREFDGDRGYGGMIGYGGERRRSERRDGFQPEIERSSSNAQLQSQNLNAGMEGFGGLTGG